MPPSAKNPKKAKSANEQGSGGDPEINVVAARYLDLWRRHWMAEMTSPGVSLLPSGARKPVL